MVQQFQIRLGDWSRSPPGWLLPGPQLGHHTEVCSQAIRSPRASDGSARHHRCLRMNSNRRTLPTHHPFPPIPPTRPVDWASEDLCGKCRDGAKVYWSRYRLKLPHRIVRAHHKYLEIVYLPGGSVCGSAQFLLRQAQREGKIFRPHRYSLKKIPPL